MITQVLSAVGPGPGISISYKFEQTPMLLCQRNASASLDYILEVTDDDPASASATWATVAYDTNSQTDNPSFTFPVTFYTSGTLTVELAT